MEFVVLIGSFAVLLLLSYYGKKLSYRYLSKYQRIKYALIIASFSYIALLIFFIIPLVKYFNYLSLILLIFLTGFVCYSIYAGIKKLQHLSPKK